MRFNDITAEHTAPIIEAVKAGDKALAEKLYEELKAKVPKMLVYEGVMLREKICKEAGYPDARAIPTRKARKPRTVELPIAKRFHALKAEHPGSLLLVRVGDFYEAFGDDATTIAKTIGLTLTTANWGTPSDRQMMPMCGFPYHSLEMYRKKLVAVGLRVALADTSTK